MEEFKVKENLLWNERYKGSSINMVNFDTVLYLRVPFLTLPKIQILVKFLRIVLACTKTIKLIIL